MIFKREKRTHPAQPVLTPGFLRALTILSAHHYDGMYAEDFFVAMWPGKKGGCNSTKGGPSGRQYAVNNLLGRIARKYPESVVNYSFLDSNRIRAGRWYIQPVGLNLVAKACAKPS